MRLPGNLFSFPLKPEHVSPVWALFLAGVLVFSNTFDNAFHLDDFHTIVFNFHVHSLSEIGSFVISGNSFSGTPGVSGYRPAILILNALNYAISGSSPAGYHLVNLAIHLIASLLVYQIAFLLTDRASIGLLAGSLFLIHPLNAEVVNYISSRSSSLYALFCLASFLAFLHYRKEAREKWLALSLAAFILALLSKEAAITLPLLFIAYDVFYPKKLKNVQKTGIYLVFLSLVILFLSARSHFMGSPSSAIPSLYPQIDESGYSEFAKKTFLGGIYLSTHYLYLFLFPSSLTIDHPFPAPAFNLRTVCELLFWLIAVFFVAAFRKQKTAPFLTSWFIISLLPVFLLPGITALSIFQENRAYLSIAGLSIFFAWILIEVKNRLEEKSHLAGRLFLTCLFGLLIFFSVISYLRNEVWKSDVTLWKDAYQKNPSSFIVSFSLGYGYLNEHQWDPALYFFKHSLELNPPGEYLYYIHNNMGAVYDHKGNRKEAFREYQTAVRLSPHLPEAHINLGLFYLNKGDIEKAGEELGAEMDSEFGHMEQRVSAALRMDRTGGSEAAERLLLKIADRLPSSSEYDGMRALIRSRLKQNVGRPF
jgi:tetratricopeptide (TPR) repeat protein